MPAIARDLGLNPITVRTHLYRARRHLRATPETRRRGGFDTVFPFDGARCACMADRVVEALGGERAAVKCGPWGAGPTPGCCAGRGCLA